MEDALELAILVQLGVTLVVGGPVVDAEVAHPRLDPAEEGRGRARAVGDLVVRVVRL